MGRAREFLAAGFRNPEDRKRGEALGLGLGLALAVTAVIAAGQGRMGRMEAAGLGSAILLSLGLILPGLLYPAARLFEEIFRLLTRATMYLLLIAVFCLLFTPVGLILRLLGRDPLDRAIDPCRATYWVDRKPNPPERAEKQF